MAQINCADCLKTYRSYRCSAALIRVFMYGFSDFREFEDEQVIEEQFREHWRDRTVRRRLINKTRTYNKDDSFAENFKFYYQYLENKRRKRMSASFLCFDCEKYFCPNCVSKHYGHLTFTTKDKNNISKWGRISMELLEKLKAEGDLKVENMKREQTYLCDFVDMRCEYDELNLRYVLWELEQHKRDDHLSIEQLDMDFWNNTRVEDLHISNDTKRWLVADNENNCIKIFNVNDNKMTRRIKLSSPPHRITEIPSTDPSHALISVSLLCEGQIDIMNIHSTPARVVLSIKVDGRCFDIATTNNKLIMWCESSLYRTEPHSIHVTDMLGEIINIIDLHNLPGIKQMRIYEGCMCVHSDSETIYVCLNNLYGPSYVISLSLDGQVLHSVTLTDMKPRSICIDTQQNVYVMSYRLPIYKLSADLKNREQIFNNDIADASRIRVMRFHNDKFYLASNKGPVYIIQYDSSYTHRTAMTLEDSAL